LRDFAKASLIDLVVLYLKQNNPGLLPPDLDQVDALRQAHVPVSFKRDILETVLHECGPKALLEVGQGIYNITYDPIWRAALASETPQVLLDKWRRLEAFSHSENRIKIEQLDQNQMRFQRYTVKGGTPGTAENLLICGLIIALLQGINCREMWCEMAQAGGGKVRILEGEEFAIVGGPVGLETNNWTIGWQACSQQMATDKADDQLAAINLPPIDDPVLLGLVKSVTAQLTRDVARQWNIGDLARELGLSARSLQRRLKGAGICFSRLVRLVRIHEACHQLRSSDTPLTVIGFCAGFSDSAHFSRDFRASVGLTPSEYRAHC